MLTIRGEICINQFPATFHIFRTFKYNNAENMKNIILDTLQYSCSNAPFMF